LARPGSYAFGRTKTRVSVGSAARYSLSGWLATSISPVTSPTNVLPVIVTELHGALKSTPPAT
jgi:hypothetical protein